MSPKGIRWSDDDIIECYCRHKSIHKEAFELGICAQTVLDRLTKYGIKRNIRRITDAERERIREEYAAHRDAGTLDELAGSMGRTKHYLARLARQMGLTNKNTKRPYHAVWKYMIEAEARVIFDQFKVSSLGMGQFCHKRGYDDLGFSRTMQGFFPDEWEHVIEAKVPRQTKYRIGRAFEYKCRDHLKSLGFFVMRSPRSSSPVDLVAIRPGEVLFVQCKRNGVLGVADWNALIELAESSGATPILAADQPRSTPRYVRMTSRKDGSRRRQPLEPFEPRRPAIGARASA